jgi:hypothetical protein
MRTNLIATLATSVVASTPAAAIRVFDFAAQCSQSYFKVGGYKSDMSSVRGTPIDCEGLVIVRLDDGTILVTFETWDTRKTNPVFAGEEISPAEKPDIFEMPVTKIYLAPAAGGQSVPMNVSAGSRCILHATAPDVRKLRGIGCVAQIGNGAQRTVYRLIARVTGVISAPPGNWPQGG